MTRSLRQWHRRAVYALCVVVPIAFGVAIALRPKVPIAAPIDFGVTATNSSVLPAGGGGR